MDIKFPWLGLKSLTQSRLGVDVTSQTSLITTWIGGKPWVP